MTIKAKITKIIENSFPIFVECCFHDAYGISHIFRDKAPIFISNPLKCTDAFPLDGEIQCILLKEQWLNNKKILTVSSEQPDHVESIEGLDEFDLLENQVNF